jgi:hypothetical protein
VRQLTGSAGTTERRYRAPTGRPGPSGSRSFGRRENPERVDVSADAPSGFFACSLREQFFVSRSSFFVSSNSKSAIAATLSATFSPKR